MTNGSQSICAAAVCSGALFGATGAALFLRENNFMADEAPNSELNWPLARLRKHADYQRVYKSSRKQQSASMSYFFRLRAEDELAPHYAGPRVGLTAGRVLGKAIERNRIKRRMREAARVNLALLPRFADVVLHPRKLVLDIEFSRLEKEVAKIFSTIATQTAKIAQPTHTGAQA